MEGGSVKNENMEKEQSSILACIESQRAFFKSNETKNVDFRKRQLNLLLQSIKKHEAAIAKALYQDLRKSGEEAYLTEIALVITEIKYHLKQLNQWSKPQRTTTPLALLPAKSSTWAQPLGCSLIISPWNYPFQLLFNPLVGAISSGCCAILKPAPETPATNTIMKTIIDECFEEKHIALVDGGIETSDYLLRQKFDFIFFTGSTRVGKIVMEAAAKHLCPVVLELGGKSPCIVSETANLELSAKRIIWGKLINAGQTCVAPDFVLVHHSRQNELKEALKQQIVNFYGTNPQESAFYPRIITSRAFDRLKKMIDEGNVYYGGQTEAQDKYIAPTILENVDLNQTVMQEEIFGPILPIIPYESETELKGFLSLHPQPLALYYFGHPSHAKKLISATESGGVCINDTLLHVSNHHLPFGGLGNSGMGKYHGKTSFEVFSHQRAVVENPTFVDLPFKYVPFKLFNWVRRLF